MRLHKIRKVQHLPISLDESWTFFSDPGNLALITPPSMNFRILSASGGSLMYSGQIIHYKVQILPGIHSDWVTEIKNVNKPFSFIDEQRLGPYKFWHHEHRFSESAGGTTVTDEVSYAIPFGLLGVLAHWVFVKGELKRIFDHRYRVLEQMFARR